MTDDDHLDPNFIKLLAPQKPEPLRPTRDYRAIDDWGKMCREAVLYAKWIGEFDPDLSATFDGYLTPPDPFEYRTVLDMRNGALQLFTDLIHAMPGEGRDKFIKLGRPKALVQILGIRPARPTDRDWDISILSITNGYSEYSARDGRIKPVIEVATGLEWPSVADLAYELGCAAGTLYNHLQGNVKYAFVMGRKFQYGEIKPVPGSIDAMTEEEREAARQHTIACGFTPNF